MTYTSKNVIPSTLRDFADSKKRLASVERNAFNLRSDRGWIVFLIFGFLRHGIFPLEIVRRLSPSRYIHYPARHGMLDNNKKLDRVNSRCLLRYAGKLRTSISTGIRDAASSGVRADICFMKNATPLSSHSPLISFAHFIFTGLRPTPVSPPKMSQSG